ncbi:MAG: glycoside hydrolase family 73 protein [Peptococcaceae bacterium]|nr:glycoside hydrolase family 73 protein [Peptococcaceae bacterium]
MRLFVFTVGVFLMLCALNLIGLTDYVEPEKTYTANAEASYQVGDPESFFDYLGPIAEKYHTYGVYPSVMLAQAALESQYGESQLSFDYNNYFGIKVHGHHKSVRLTTTEYYSGKKTTIKDDFCVYSSPSECFKDYAELLTQNAHFADAVEAASPAIAARALQEGGYATDPSYASKLISLINEYNLTRFDPMTRPKATTEATENTQAASTTEEGTDNGQ